MRRLRAFAIRLASIFTRDRADHDLAAELESHLQLHIDDNLRAGMSPDAARRHALVVLGGVELTKERYRDRLGFPAVDALRQDLVYAARALRKNPGFTVVAVLTLALGIGATSAIFSVVNAVLLQPLPFRDPQQLVMVFAVGHGNDRHDVVSYPTFVDWRDQSSAFEGAAAYASRSLTVADGAESNLVLAKRVTPSLFPLLGARAALGRLFYAGEDAADRSKVVILSDGFWKRRFGADRAVIGRTLRVNDEPHTIVGVMPPEFHIDPPEREQLYTPLPIDTQRDHGFLRMIGRLRPGVTRAGAQRELDVITQRLTRLYGRSNEAVAVNIEPLGDALAGPSRLALLVLFGAVTLVLLVACTNVACLMLARSASRQREIAVRAALGAGRGRLARQLLTESIVLALGGGALGLLLAGWLARLLVFIVRGSVEVPRLESTSTDITVLLFTLGVSVATGVLFGVAPALTSSSPDLTDALRDGSRAATGAAAPKVRRLLVVVETALALVLLAGAGVLIRTVLTMRSTHPGFETGRMLAVELWLPPTRFATVHQRARFLGDALPRVRAVPGVVAAAFVADLPLYGPTDTESFHIVGRPDPAPGRRFNSGFNIASAGYFRMMGIPVREGREFLESDHTTGPGVVIVNESAARKFWPGESPLGHQIDLPITRVRSVVLTVVGVSGDVRHGGLGEAPRPQIYVNSSQSELNWPWLVLAVRTATAPLGASEAVRAAIRAASSDVPISRISTMDDVVARSMATPRLLSLLLGAFAIAAAGLAAVGLYGLVSYSVAQRSHEMGIRVALGATRADVMRLVVREGLWLVAAGAALGLLGGMAATRVLVSLVSNARANDPATYAAVTTLLVAAGIAASYLPARRAARVDPITALRVE
jgi:putative ABC transport system permease protein